MVLVMVQTEPTTSGCRFQVAHRTGLGGGGDGGNFGGSTGGNRSSGGIA